MIGWRRKAEESKDKVFMIEDHLGNPLPPPPPSSLSQERAKVLTSSNNSYGNTVNINPNLV